MRTIFSMIISFLIMTVQSHAFTDCRKDCKQNNCHKADDCMRLCGLKVKAKNCTAKSSQPTIEEVMEAGEPFSSDEPCEHMTNPGCGTDWSRGPKWDINHFSPGNQRPNQHGD